MANPVVNVLVLVPTLDIGGVETDLVRTLPLIDRGRFSVSVLTFLRRGVLADQLGAEGIRVITLPPKSLTESERAGTSGPKRLHRWPPMRHWARRWAPRSLIRGAERLLSGVEISARIAHTLRDPSIDVIHAVLPNSYLVGTLANLFARRRPLVMSRVSLNWYQQDSAVFKILERYLVHRSVDMAIGNSRAVLQDLRCEGIPDSKLRLVRNGIDASAFASTLLDRETARAHLGIDQADLVMSVVANLHARKGHADLLRALATARKRLPARWTLLAAGGDVAGSLGLLEDLAVELGLSDHVRFLGQRTDVGTILSASDIHVSASHTESFPNNILEAMCARLPIVATNVGGVSEQLADGSSGILVPAQAPDELARAIGKLAGDRELRIELGRAARDRVVHAFPIQPAVTALEEIYGGLAERRHMRSEKWTTMVGRRFPRKPIAP